MWVLGKQLKHLGAPAPSKDFLHSDRTCPASSFTSSIWISGTAHLELKSKLGINFLSSALENVRSSSGFACVLEQPKKEVKAEQSFPTQDSLLPGAYT